MATRMFLLTIFCLLLSIESIRESKETEPNIILKSAYEELASKGFPSGLLPTNVVNYSMNKSSGAFSVKLSDRCYVVLPPDNYPASFSKVITGRLTEGYIQGLNGIRVRAYFKWWSITGIRSSGGDLVFEVGRVTAKYPSANFDESPDCEGNRASS